MAINITIIGSDVLVRCPCMQDSMQVAIKLQGSLTLDSQLTMQLYATGNNQQPIGKQLKNFVTKTFICLSYTSMNNIIYRESYTA